MGVVWEPKLRAQYCHASFLFTLMAPELEAFYLIILGVIFLCLLFITLHICGNDGNTAIHRDMQESQLWQRHSDVDHADTVRTNFYYTYSRPPSQPEYVVSRARLPQSTTRRRVYSEEDVVKMAAKDRDRTYLMTNIANKVYLNDGKMDHAEMKLLQDLQGMSYGNVCKITEIKIKNSPCIDCAKSLVWFYKSNRITANKLPVIYIGSIYRNKNTSDYDEDAILCLLYAGFRVYVWYKMHVAMYGQHNRETYNRLEAIKDGVNDL